LTLVDGAPGDAVARGAVRLVPMVAAALLSLTSVSRSQSASRLERGGAPPPLGGSALVWGDAELRTQVGQKRLQGQLEAASRAVGSPVAIFLVERLSHSTAASLAEEAFESHQMADAGTDAILLLVAVHDQQAVIETGKGPFGLVPEIDARGIVSRLARHLTRANLAGRLSPAIRDIVASARATRLRRQPLPPDEIAGAPTAMDSKPASRTGAGDPGPTEPAAGESPAATNLPAAVKPRSRLPFAIAAGVLFLVSLALYKRNQMSSSRKPPPPVIPRRADGRDDLTRRRDT
jgi:uncharacterized membrane protein YgcG